MVAHRSQFKLRGWTNIRGKYQLFTSKLLSSTLMRDGFITVWERMHLFHSNIMKKLLSTMISAFASILTTYMHIMRKARHFINLNATTKPWRPLKFYRYPGHPDL